MHILQNATTKELELAEARLHTEVFSMIATVQQGQIISKDGLTYTYSANGPQPGGMVLFPELDEDRAGPLLDEMMDYYRQRQALGIGCYALHIHRPADLGIRLLARGFQPGWLPCWMAKNLDAMRETISLPPGVELQRDNSTSTEGMELLPYSGNKGIGSPLLMESYAPRTQRILAIQDGQIIGQSAVILTTREPAVAGIFNVGVVHSFRNQGIGRALVLAACQYAKDHGYGYALLNATGQRMYRQAGFEYIGMGCTWWLQNKRYITHPPTPDQVALTEAVCRGDIEKLECVYQSAAVDLNEPLANGMPLMEMAVYYKHPRSAQWLIDHGARYTPLDAWNLGWKELFINLLASDPQQVNRTYGHMHQTLLHIAAEKNDTELAQLTLQAGPDLGIRDTIHHATALDWARFFQRTKLAELLQQHSK
jgi:FOG: Ankyrin repeat